MAHHSLTIRDYVMALAKKRGLSAITMSELKTQLCQVEGKSMATEIPSGWIIWKAMRKWVKARNS
jgi:hypothetical protein